MIEKGSDIQQRACPMVESDSPCVQCSLCSILCGWGGAGAYSDGKLTLTPEFGGWLKDYLSAEELSLFIDYVDAVYLSFGAGGAASNSTSSAPRSDKHFLRALIAAITSSALPRRSVRRRPVSAHDSARASTREAGASLPPSKTSTACQGC